MKPTLAFLLLAFLLLSGCTGNTATPPVEEPDELLVAAAGSLQLAFTELGEAYEAANDGQLVTFTFTNTGNLVSQIENGAPFDLLAAADVASVEQLAAQGLIVPESQALYAQGRLVVAVTTASTLATETLDSLRDPTVEHISLASPEHAPYGRAAQQALQNAGLWETVEPKLVIGETVGQAVQFVQSGNAQAALTALSVADIPEMRWSLVDPALYDPLDQALGILESSSQKEAAARFVAFIQSDEGQAILEAHGLFPPNDTTP